MNIPFKYAEKYDLVLQDIFYSVQSSFPSAKFGEIELIEPPTPSPVPTRVYLPFLDALASPRPVLEIKWVSG